MANLQLWKWKQYLPNLGGNLDEEKPFFLRLKSGLPKAEFVAWADRWGKAIASESVEEITAVLGEVTEMGSEPLTVNGQPISALRDYVELAMAQSNYALILEVGEAFGAFNRFGTETQVDFSARRSGGSFSTPTAPKTAAPDSGSRTRK